MTERCRQTDLGVVPQDWRQETIGAVTAKIGSGITPTGGSSRYRDSGRPFVRSQNVGWGRLLLEDIAFIDEVTHASFSGTEIQNNDVLLNITGASIGRVAVADQRLTGGNVNQHVCIVRARPAEANSRFLGLLLLSSVGQRQIDSFQAGGNRQGLNFSQVAAIKVVLPPTIREQEAIASALSDADALIESLEQLLAKKRHLKQGAMQELLTGKKRLPGFRGEWESRPLASEIAALESGVSVNSTTEDYGVGDEEAAVLKTSCVDRGVFSPSECKPILAKDRARARLNPRAHTILISRMNTIDLVGECGYVDSDYPQLFVPDRLWLTRFRRDAGVSARWLAYVLSSETYRQSIKGLATGTSGSMKNISQSAMLAMTVSFPGIAEQSAIATILSDMDAEIAALEAKVEKARQVKQGMMQELLTGRIRLA